MVWLAARIVTQKIKWPGLESVKTAIEQLPGNFDSPVASRRLSSSSISDILLLLPWEPASTRCTTSGSRSITVRYASIALSGLVRPCSRSRSRAALIRYASAKPPWLNPVCARTACTRRANRMRSNSSSVSGGLSGSELGRRSDFLIRHRIESRPRRLAHPRRIIWIEDKPTHKPYPPSHWIGGRI